MDQSEAINQLKIKPATKWQNPNHNVNRNFENFEL
jgi:hypothetical protein